MSERKESVFSHTLYLKVIILYQNVKLIYDVNGVAVAISIDKYEPLRAIEKPVAKDQSFGFFDTL